MIEQYAQSLAHFLQSHPNWGGLITFFIAFLESLAVVGTIIPGSVTMTAVGMLIGTGILPFGITLLWATLGAFLGDLISYWLGIHYNERLRKMWPFKKHPEWLDAGESFFHKHGGKSILIGRFIGPLRSIIPLIAGVLHMPIQKFSLAAIPAACLWALAYMLPGILLGALSLQLPPNVATKFILILLALILLLSVFAWLISFCSNRLTRITRHFLKTSWHKLQTNKHYDWFTHRIASKDYPDDYQYLGWVILSVISFLIFIIIAFNVFEHTALTFINRPVFEFLRSIRSSKTDEVMIGMTLLGDSRVIAISSTLLIIGLLTRKKIRDAIHWFVAIFTGLIITNIFKNLLYFPRPTGLVHVSSSSSFPSGHTFLAFMFYGFFAAFAATHIKKRYRRYVYYFAGTIIMLVAFSRIYLGAHWFSDVIASIVLGFACLALIILSYRRKVYPIKIANFIIFGLVTVTIVCFCYFKFDYQKNIKRYSLDWPSQVIDENTWWGRLNPALTVYRQNRLGQPAEPMNIQFSGDVAQLKRALIEKGWNANSKMTLLNSTIQKLSPTHGGVTTLLPSLHLNKTPVLYMIKTKKNKQLEQKLILKLWTSSVYLAESWDVIFIGNLVEYQFDQKRKKITYSYNVIGELMRDLSPDTWRTKVISATKPPQELLKQKWNAEILEISAPALY